MLLYAGTNTWLTFWPPKNSYSLFWKYSQSRIGVAVGNRKAWSRPIFQASLLAPKISMATWVASFGCSVWSVTAKDEPPQSPCALAPAVHWGSGAARHFPDVVLATLCR